MTAQELMELMEKRSFSALKTGLSEMHAGDIAEILEELSPEGILQCFRLLPKELAAEVFVEMNSDDQEKLISSFTDAELHAVVTELYVDDTVDIIEEMPASVVRRILAAADPAQRRSVNEILRYPKDSAGSIMTTEYVSLLADMTVEEAFAKIKKTGPDSETIYTCYVLSPGRQLLGTVSAKQLLLSPLEKKIDEIMETNLLFAYTDDDREQAVATIRDYGLLALPITDREQRMVGIVTVDDALDVITEESEEDFSVMAAITPSGDSYLKTGVFKLWGSRIPWLLLLMVSATFTGMIITGFEDRLSSFTVLTAFIPMLMDSGGNSGSQASVTVIRALSLGDVIPRDILKVLWKEIRVAVLCGVVLSVANFGKMMLVDRLLLGNAGVTPIVAAVVCTTLALTVLVAKSIGCSLPILAKKIGFDPAVMASPFITTIVDALSLLIYFSVSALLIPGFGG